MNIQDSRHYVNVTGLNQDKIYVCLYEHDKPLTSATIMQKHDVERFLAFTRGTSLSERVMVSNPEEVREWINAHLERASASEA